MKRTIKKNFPNPEFAGKEIEIFEESSRLLQDGIYPPWELWGLFGKWALEDFIERRPTVSMRPKASIKLWYGHLDGATIVVAEDELEER